MHSTKSHISIISLNPHNPVILSRLAYLSLINPMHFIPLLKMRQSRFREVEARFKPRQSDF